MKKILLKTLIITLIFELIIFNITTYTSFVRTIGKDKKEYVVGELDYFIGEDNRTVYELRDINVPVATVKVEFSCAIDKPIDYNLAYSDDTSDGLRYFDDSKVYTPKFDRTQYMSTHFSGNVKALDVNVDHDSKEIFPIEKVVLNEVIPISVVIPRLVSIFLIVFLVTSIKSSKVFSEKYDKKNIKQEIILIMSLYVTFFLLFSLSVMVNKEGVIDTNLELYTKEFIDALEKGQFHLDIDVSDKLLELDNPYDQVVRDEFIERDVDYIWDTAYKDGKYYMYFGILPALTLLLPFHKLTGIYMSSAIAILVYEFLSLIVLKSILEKVIENFFENSNIKFKTVFCMNLILYFGTLFFYIMGIPRMYELVMIAGVYAVLQAIWFIFKAFEKDKLKPNYIYLFLASLFMAASIAARPTQIFMSVLIAIIGIKLLIKFIKEKDVKNIIKLVISIGIPYIAIAVLLMSYNYVRFGNVLEFGASYQLTVNNMDEIKTGLVSSIGGVLVNLFNIPNITMDFPYLTNNNNVLVFYGYYYYENMIAGAFFFVPLLFVLFDIFKINKNKNVNKKTKILIDILLVISIIMAVLNASMGGSTGRYLVDYMWILVLVSEMIFVIKYDGLETDEAKKIYNKILNVITIYVIIFAVFSGIVSEKSRFYENSPAEYYALKYMISFWE